MLCCFGPNALLRQEVDEFVVVTFSMFKNAVQILGCMLYILFGLSGEKVSSSVGGSFTHLSKLVGIAAATVRSIHPNVPVSQTHEATDHGYIRFHVALSQARIQVHEEQPRLAG
jgi:hypothetical protein